MSMNQAEDRECIERVLAGDRDAYRFLVDRYQDMAYSLAFSMLREETAAEDAAQEGFIQAYERLVDFRRESKFSTWLYTIVYRTALRQSRRGRRYVPLPPASEERPTPDPDQLEKLSQTEQLAYVRKAISRLPELEAAIVTLYYFEENSVATVARITGLTATNVKIKLFRARKKLGKILSPIIAQL